MITVLSVAYPFAPVREDTPGGAEQVLLAIDSEIVNRNHKSIVIAHQDSKVKGKHIEIPKVNATIRQSEKSEIYYKVNELIKFSIEKYSPDIIHYHGLDFYDYHVDCSIPSIVTLHLPLELYNIEKLNQCKASFNCVSYYQHQRAVSVINRLITYIQNGTQIPDKINRKENPKYVFCSGRVCPEKGYHLAIEAAKMAEVPLIFAGEVFNYPEHITYFETKIKPCLDSLNYRFIGKIGLLQKEYLYDNALCVLIPSLIDETSSLVAMEALAHGTPVIAFKRGALSEIIIDGVNGFLVQNVNEMAEAVQNVGKLSSEVCFKIAREKYDQRIMVKKYLNSYFKLICDNSQNELTNK